MFCNGIPCLQENSQRVTDSLNEFTNELVADFNYFIRQVENYFGPKSFSEHFGIITKVEPLAQDIPKEYVGKCYHRIKLSDGSSFNLIFDHMDFEEIEDQIQEGHFVKIRYQMPSYDIINIFPKPYIREMDFDQVLDDIDVANNQKVEATYYQGRIKKIVFLDSDDEEEEQSQGESYPMVELEDSEVPIIDY